MNYYVDEVSTDNNYGIYESLIKNETDYKKSVGLMNDKKYLFKYDIYDHYDELNKMQQNIIRGHFIINLDKKGLYINYTDKTENRYNISKFNLEAIIGILLEVYKYDKEFNKKTEVIIPDACFVDLKERTSDNAAEIIELCYQKYMELLNINKSINK